MLTHAPRQFPSWLIFDVGQKKVKILTAILFSVMAAIAGFVGELWHISRDPTYSPELGFAVAAGGLAFFGIVGGAMFYAYGALSRAIRKEDKIAAYWMPAALGFVYWFLLLGVHGFLRDSMRVPDALWWIESAVICGVSFEIIRYSCRSSKRRPNQPPQTTRAFGPRV